jgi:hypothetical protein
LCSYLYLLFDTLPWNTYFDMFYPHIRPPFFGGLLSIALSCGGLAEKMSTCVPYLTYLSKACIMVFSMHPCTDINVPRSSDTGSKRVENLDEYNMRGQTTRFSFCVFSLSPHVKTPCSWLLCHKKKKESSPIVYITSINERRKKKWDSV